ncbi:PLDc N-terminal domain-containing protein [Nocardiopsis quinghaiensis]|uniref:PLDc N-terminal domain-containing protein n=1 Tax=Nocardiopsis quinghaiensis TaxID=464995 RepID=UPI001238AB01|nr:PLDc N-terminal domain-containing protein [Nocardiopsis quinghaiensis]
MAHFLLLLAVLSICVWVYALFEVIGSDPGSVRLLPKPAWTVVVLLLPKLGALLWFALGRPHRDPAVTAPAGPPPAFPEYDHPSRARAATPEEDEEFLRRCRERAEGQRRRAREAQERKRREREARDDGEAAGDSA